MRYRIFTGSPDLVERELNECLENREAVKTIGTSTHRSEGDDTVVTVIAIVGPESEFAAGMSPSILQPVQPRGLGNMR